MLVATLSWTANEHLALPPGNTWFTVLARRPHARAVGILPNGEGDIDRHLEPTHT